MNYNLAGLIICVGAAAFSWRGGWRGAALPVVICLLYVIFMSADASILGQFFGLGEIAKGSRAEADIHATICALSLFLAIVAIYIITRLFERRRAKVLLIYAGWLVVAIVLNGLHHLAIWEGPGVYGGLTIALQIGSVAADVFAAWIGGDNFVSNYIFSRLNRHFGHRRRRNDMVSMEGAPQ